MLGRLRRGSGFFAGRFGIWARFGFGVFLEAEIVGGLECAGEDVFGGRSEDDVGHAHAAPAAGDGEEHFGEFGDEGLLLLESEHEIAVTLLGGSERGEDAAVDAEVGLAHVGGFLDVRGGRARCGGSRGGSWGVV